MTAPLVICSTPRLAHGLRHAWNLQQMAQGAAHWPPLNALTLPQWLERWTHDALLRGEIAADTLPGRVLNAMQERLLWERAIADALAANPAQALFDVAGLAASAAEAEHLLEAWQVALPPGAPGEETRQFLAWRTGFEALCRQHRAVTADRWLAQQIGWLEAGIGRVPERLYLAGFDRLSRQEQRLLDSLAARGVAIAPWPLAHEAAGQAAQAAYDTAEDECRAAAAWARARLEADPQARLAIVVPDLKSLHDRLAAILDDTLHPETLSPAQAGAPRCYDFSLGQPLARQPMIRAALDLLHLATQRYRLPQNEIGRLLRNPYWSAGPAGARARLEAMLRRRLPAAIDLGQLVRQVRRAEQDGLPLPELVEQLEHLQAQARAWPKRQLPSHWAHAFDALLAGLSWPGRRGLSSHEYQARQRWDEALAAMAAVDDLLGPLTAVQALQQLRRQCQEQIFQPESSGEARLLVLGLLETAAVPLDALWVMGMNDHVWPPPARPNPLLPAASQRAAGSPNAGSAVQAEFAAVIHRRLLRSAAQAIFSCARREGDRELRASPLLAGIPRWETPAVPAPGLAERLAEPAALEWLQDDQAPPVGEGEQVRGGAGLLRAQAICPAWAFYQYRLGARALDEPQDGLDATERGTLLHAVLQCFWQGRDSAWLAAQDDAALQQAMQAAVAAGMQQFGAARDEPLPAQFARLEAERLQALLAAWLALEKQRDAFRVVECERAVELDVAGIAVRLTLDRVDELADGRLVVLDYKTGNQVSCKSWAAERITEPQLPIYAALALREGEVAAVCFAKVSAAEQKFVGIAAGAELLPGVDALDSERARKLFPQENFPHWPALLEHWRSRLAAIAGELKAGHAAVSFTDEAELEYCEVKPLLRLAERKMQQERQR